MERRTRALTVALASMALVASLSMPGIFLRPLNAFRADNYYSEGWLLVAAVDILRVLFLVLPIVAFMGALRGKRWSLYPLMAFPAVAWVFGAEVLPFVSLLAEAGLPRAILITLMNVAFFGAAICLFRKPAPDEV